MDYQQNQQIEIQDDEDQNKLEVELSRLPHILEESRKLILNFIEELKEKALTPISQQVLEYYHGQIKPNYHVKDILNIVDKRISKMIRNKKIKKNWNFDDIVLLLWFVSKYISIKEALSCQTFTNEDWVVISKLIPGSSSKGCMFKFISLKKIKLSLFNWSTQEENMLRSLVEKLGLNKWKQISEYLYEHNPTSKIFRTPKQCRQHWNCYLDPLLKKGPWSQTEDIKLLQNVRQNKGQRKWSSIKYLFEGRTQNALKNRYNLLLDRQKKATPDKNETELIKQYLKTKVTSQSTIQYSPISLSEEIYIKQSDIKAVQQIFEQVHEGKIKGHNQNQNKIPQILMKSQKSSFKLPEAQAKSNLQNQQYHSNELNSQQRLMPNFMFMNFENIASIIANKQGFYTNLVYKSFYRSDQ